MKTNLGKVAVTPMGEYSATTAYKRLDVVSYGSGSWMALQDCKGIEPSDGAYWMKLVDITKEGIINALGYEPAKKQNGWTHIETIEITEEGIRRIDRDTEKLKAFLLFSDNTGLTTAAPSGSLTVVANNGAFGSQYGFGEKIATYAYMCVRNGILLGYRGVANGADRTPTTYAVNQYSVAQAVAKKTSEDDYISSYKIVFSSALIVGQKFDVYGVKA